MKSIIAIGFLLFTYASTAAGLGNLFGELTKKPPTTPQPAPQAPKPPAPPVKK
jgi:hypothetical protein